jgi:hypothetical protein
MLKMGKSGNTGNGQIETRGKWDFKTTNSSVIDTSLFLSLSLPAITMTTLTLFCLVDGQSTSFPVEISSDKAVGQLKDAIKTKKPNDLRDVDADKLTLWRVDIPDEEKSFTMNEDKKNVESADGSKHSVEPLAPASKAIGRFFQQPAAEHIHVFVQRPPPGNATPAQCKPLRVHSSTLTFICIDILSPSFFLPIASKRPLEDAGEGPSSKHHRPGTLMDAIVSSGLARKAIVDGYPNLTTLDSKERVMVLKHLGQPVGMSNKYFSLCSTARALRDASADLQSLELLSAPDGTLFPIVGTQDLYVREGYKRLLQDITTTFTDSPQTERSNRIVITGTPGIGKSAFLPYFVVRVLAGSDDDKPPIVVFHTKDSETCYAYGGTSVVCTGQITEFGPLLDLPETWYLVDSSDKPVLGPSKTIISASPNTLVKYKEVMKEVVWTYYLAPWELQELEKCRTNVRAFSVMTLSLMKKLYDKIGGVPRYVLQKPTDSLFLHPTRLDLAENQACCRIEEAIANVDNPTKYIECLTKAEEHLDISGRIFHRWPTDEHRNFEYRWASPDIQKKMYDRLDLQSWRKVVESAVRNDAPGVDYEAFVAHIFRKGGRTFETRELGTTSHGKLAFPEKPTVTTYRTVADLSTLPDHDKTLYLPASSNFPCIDAALGPNKLFQMTMSDKHPIKQAEFEKIINSIHPPTSTSTGTDTLELYFVVPDDKFDDYQVQGYHTQEKNVSKKVPKVVQDVRQFALKFNLKSASIGVSPSMDNKPLDG